MGRGRLTRARLSTLAALATFLLLSHAGPARAEAPAAVRLVLPACNGAAFDQDSFARTVEIELRADGVERVDLALEEAPPPPVPLAAQQGAPPVAGDVLATITIRAVPCSPEARDVEISIDDAATSKMVRRRLSLEDVSRPARPRALALALAELLRASWTELRIPEAAKPAVVIPASVRLALFAPPPPAPPSPAPAPKEAPSVVGLRAALATRLFPAYGSALLGADVGASLGSAERIPLRLRVDAALLFGTSYDPLGTISSQLFAGGVAAVFAHRSGPLEVEIGPRLEAGYGRLAGSATVAGVRATSGGGAVVDLSGTLDLRMALGRSFWASLAVDVGGVLQSVGATTSSGREAGFGGPMAGASIGVGRSF
jgi:hypothetical protein